jgi:O-antigen ligase
MKKMNAKPKSKRSKPITVSILGSALITLYFNQDLQDPFNSPKMWILILLASWLTGYVIISRNQIWKNPMMRNLSLTIVVFNFVGLISSLASENLFTGIFGENQRRNGFLAYLALCLIFLVVSQFMQNENLGFLFNTIFVTSILIGSYSLLQTMGLDFFKWNNPYNSIIATVGNPNFAAAIMAVFAVLMLGILFNKGSQLVIRLISFPLIVLLILDIKLSNSRQGLIVFAIGLMVMVLTLIYLKNKILGYFLSIAFGLFSTIGILGMLKIGPAAQFLYKESVSLRGYYWRAGLEMLKNHPWFGVGLDNYGTYFKQYRESSYPIKYGYEISSTNAHNVPIQLFATGGFIYGTIYLSLLVFIFIRGIKAIRNSPEKYRIQIVSVFSAWVAFQSQSLISIDNLGISIWGWVLGGVLVACSVDKSDSYSGSPNQVSVQPVVSAAISLLAIFLIAPLYTSEVNMMKARMWFNPSQELNKPYLYEAAMKVENGSLVDPGYKVVVGSYLLSSGYENEGIAVVKKVLDKNSRNLDALQLISEYWQYKENYEREIYYRNLISENDPWNARNLLALGEAFKKQGDTMKMQEVLEKILRIAPDSEISNLAQSLLTT